MWEDFHRCWGFKEALSHSWREAYHYENCGKTDVYKWWMPNGNFFHQIGRAIRAAPIIFWGIYGSHLPFRNPIHVVVGKPIELKRNPQPTTEECVRMESANQFYIYGVYNRMNYEGAVEARKKINVHCDIIRVPKVSCFSLLSYWWR